MSIATNLQHIQQRIDTAKQQYGRVSDTVKLLAVSKQQSAAAIKEAYTAGQTVFGENYLQEALIKQQQLHDLAIEWHFIGHIQSNKAKLVAQNFSWVHTIDRLEIAEKLSRARGSQLALLNCCIQVNISNEATKNGVLPLEAILLAEQMQALPNLRLRGLMAIPAKTEDFNLHLQQFQQVKSLFLQLQHIYPHFDTLSMGMSADLETAIAQGSTLLRIGTAIFGSRHKEIYL